MTPSEVRSPSILKVLLLLTRLISLSSLSSLSLGCGIDRSFYASSEDLEYDIEQFDKLYRKPLKLASRIADTYSNMAIAAEFKKASPSKGDINSNLDPVTQCLEYAP